MESLRKLIREETERSMLSEHASEHAMDLPGFLKIIESIVSLAPGAEIEYPDDAHGHASVSGNLDDAKKRMKEIREFYEKDNERVGFYIWNIRSDKYADDTAIGEAVKKGPVSIFAFLHKNPEIANRVKRIRISLSSEMQKKFGKAMSSGIYGAID